MSENVEENISKTSSNDTQAAVKMSSIVKTLMYAQNWLTGKADIDNCKDRLETDHIMLGFFNSMHSANNNLLHGFDSKPEDATTNPKSLNKKIKKFCQKTIDTAESFFYYWTFIVSIACIYNLFTIPLTIFQEFRDRYYFYCLCGGWFTDFINLIDIFFQTKREFLEDGVKITEWKTTYKNYSISKIFIFDILALFPTDIFFILFPYFSFIRLNRLLKIYRISEFIQRTEIRTNFPHCFRLFRLISICIILFHWNACFYFIMSIIYNYKEALHDDWVFSYDKILDVVTPKCDARWERENCSIGVNNTVKNDTFIDESAAFFHNRTTIVEFSSLTKKYGLSFYWSALTLTTIGEQPHPKWNPQFLFEIFDTLLGLIIFAVIVGDVGAMVSSMNLVRTSFEEKLDGCKRYMKFRKVNNLLARKIIHWFEYSWKEGNAKVDESNLINSLPSRLHGQLAVHIHMDTLRKVALFQDCEPTLLYELVLKLQLQLFSAGDYVCRKGDIGKDLYIIKKGKLDVVSEDGKQVFVTLKEGAVFGELSVLNIRGNKNGNRRTASIRSVGYSDLYALTKSDLWEVLREYPEDKKKLIEKGKSILRKDNLLMEDNSIDSDDELDDPVSLEKRLEYIAKQVRKTNIQLDKYEQQFHTSVRTFKQKLTQLEKRYVSQARKLRKTYENLLDDN